jgi:hypothetical protein
MSIHRSLIRWAVVVGVAALVGCSVNPRERQAGAGDGPGATSGDTSTGGTVHDGSPAVSNDGAPAPAPGDGPPAAGDGPPASGGPAPASPIPGLFHPAKGGSGKGVAVAGASGVIDLRTSECFNRPVAKLWELPDGRYKRPFVPKGPVGATYDLRGVMIEANPLQHPVLVDDPHDTCLVGITVQGQQARSLNWQQMKSGSKYHLMDGDGVGWENSTGEFILEGAWIDNMEDGLGPPYDLVPDKSSTWSMRHVYMKYIRDDAIENDGCLSGEVIDSFFDGIWTFLSTRPGKVRADMGQTTITIRDSLIRHSCMPDPRQKNNGCGSKTGTGELFKSHSSCKVKINMKDTVILKEGARKGDDFLPGTYSNVTLVWVGGGQYPGAKPPPGVTLTTNPAVWNKARAGWIKRHGCDSNAANCSFLHAAGTKKTPPPGKQPYVVLVTSPAFVPLGNGSGLMWWTENVSSCKASGKDFKLGGASGGTRVWSSTVVQPMFQLSCTASGGAVVSDTDRSTWFKITTDSTKPGVPGSVKASASPGSITLTWKEASDNFAIASYRVYRDGAWITTVSGKPSYRDPAVSPGKSYAYQVQAFDAFGNLSPKSAAVSVTAK